jgi:hypothetical protein
MGHLDDIKELIAKGDNESAINTLISELRNNSNDVDKWLLLGEIIDDHEKKRDCYQQALKLSPYNPLALDGLLKLESPQKTSKINSQTKAQATKPRIRNMMRFESNKDEWKIAIIFFGILGAFFGISYLIGLIINGNDSPEGDPLCTGMFCLVLIISVVIWYSSGKNRTKTVNDAIQEQKQTSFANSKYSNENSNNIVHCRVCHNTVSRISPTCPNCGELYPGLISKCPYCGSKNILITVKGFSAGKAAAGGLLGRKDLEVKCSNCRRSTTIKSHEIG